MKPIILVIVAALVALLGGNAHSEESVSRGLASFASLMAAKSLRCTFTEGSQAEWKNGAFKISKGKYPEDPVQFDAIDLRAHKARLIGNVGAGEIAVIPSPAGISFIEQPPEGNPNITTVFADGAPSSREFLAVASRHVAILGVVMPSQSYGRCKIWE